MAAADYKALVQSIYISYFGRPADTFGLISFEQQLSDLNAPTTVNGLTAAYSTSAGLRSLIDSFGTSAESTALYGTDTVAFVTAIYANVLNRAPDFDGLKFWVTEINAGHLTKANASLAIMAGAQNNTSAQGLIDAQVLANKVIIATNFTDAIDTGPELAAYNGNAAAATARDMLKSVTASTVPSTFQATVDATLAALVTASIPVVNVSLTNGIDTINGAGGNDVFTAVMGNTDVTKNTLTVLDTIDGKGGNNVLNLTDLNAAGSALPGQLNISNVQTVNLTSVGIAALNTTTGFSGLTNLNVVTSTGADNITAGSGTAVNVFDAAGTVTITGGSTQTVNTSGGVVLSGATGAIVVTDVAQAAVASTINDGTSVSVKNTVTTGALTIGGTTAPTGAVTVNETVKGVAASGTITINGGTVDTVTLAASNTAKGTTTLFGAVVVNGTAVTTSVSVTEAAVAAAVPSQTAVAAVTDVESFAFSNMTAGQTVTVGGLTYTSIGASSAAQVAAAFANLADGAIQGNSTKGTYSGQFTGFTTGAAATATVTFTSTNAGPQTPLAVTGSISGTATTVTAGVAAIAAAGKVGVTQGAVTVHDVNYGTTTAGTITNVSLDGYASATIQDNALATLSLANTTGKTVSVSNVTATTLGLTVNKLGAGSILNLDAAAAAGTYKTLNVTTATAGSTLNVTGAAVTALNVSGSNSLNLTSSTFTALKTVSVSGAAGVTLNASGATVTDVNASASTGSNAFTIDGTKATYEGGSGNDKLVLTGGATKVISLGDGNDSVTLAAGTTTVAGSIAGGNGTDTLIMNNADAVAASATGLFATKVTGFENLTLVADGSTTIAHIDVLGGFNAVTTGAATSVMTIDGFTSGGTLTLAANVGNDGATIPTDGSYVVTGTSFAAGTADVFNIAVTGNAANTAAGSVTVAKVETINIAANDTGADDVAGDVTHSLTLVAADAKAINVTGMANLHLTATAAAVTTVDASAMTGGLEYTTSGAVAQTVKGGAGMNTLTAHSGSIADVLIGGASNDIIVANAGMDILTGNGGNDTFVITASSNLNSYATITDANVGDSLHFGGALATATSFSAAKVSLAATAVFQDYANAAVNSSASAGAISWFQYNGDTYVVEHNHTTGADFQPTDIVVKLTGLVDLGNTSLSTDHSMLLIG